MDGEVISTLAPAGVFWTATANLRFERRVVQVAPNSGSMVNFLQQAWADVYSGKVEWRDVPVVEASNER